MSLPVLTRTPVILDQGHTLMTSFNPITSLQTPCPNIVTLRVKDSTYEFWEDTIQFITDMIVDIKKYLKFIVTSCRVHTCLVAISSGNKYSLISCS